MNSGLRLDDEAAAANVRQGPVLRVLGSLGVALVLVSVLAALTDRETLTSLARTVDPLWLALSFLAFCVGTSIRALRFEVLSRPHAEPTIVPLLRVTAIHQLLLMVIPFRMGELSYPVLMRSHLGRAIPQGVGDLLFVRLLDLVLSGVCFGVGLLALPAIAAAGSEMFVLAGLVVVAGCWALFQLPAAVRLCRRLLVGLGRAAPFSSPRAARRFMRELDRSVRGVGAEVLAPVAGLSLVLTLVGIARISLLFAAFGIEASLLTSALLLGANNLLGLVPLHGFGGLGPKQAGMAGVLVLLGFASSTAASLTLLFQATVILFITALGALAYGSWLLDGRRRLARAKR